MLFRIQGLVTTLPAGGRHAIYPSLMDIHVIAIMMEIFLGLHAFHHVAMNRLVELLAQRC